MTVVQGLGSLLSLVCLVLFSVLLQGVVWFLGVFFLLGPVLNFHFTRLEESHVSPQ